MNISMETPTPVQGTRARRPVARWSTAIGTAVLLAIVTVVVVGLAAISLGPKLLPYQALVVRSGSMEPTIPTGSVVFYKKLAAAKVRVGDIIVFAKPGQPNEKVTHRVYQVGSAPTGRYFVTKGDANGTPDDWRVPATGTGWVASFHIPYAGYLLADLQSPLGKVLLLLIPAILLAVITLYEILTERRRGTAA